MLGAIEHQVVSAIKGFIPETVQQKWHDYWQSIKKAETHVLGDDDISDTVEMAGWGVEKASERNKTDASKFRLMKEAREI